ncbi:PAS domain-containing protein [Siculibacillus lacustris]|uniref:PAS domain-containing protein n=1 Tax=Siculibacillus lacustris TaxID=1549641 RepID=A0A4Q9VWZ5_9HYPH|nr:PAS domain-containing protein [Siculibacillus lacustris]TBW40897.1 PAS domain-containing protein [Siculibacillus lacustris]
MRSLVDVVKKVGYAVDIGYWLVDVDKRQVYLPKGLGRPHGPDDPPVETGYQVLSLERTVACVEEPDRDRFRAYLAEILQSPDCDRVVEVAWHASWGGRIHLRLAARRVGTGPGSRIVGLVEVLNRWKEAEHVARSLSFIIEALFISSDDGIIIFDAHLKVRRLNRNALELFGITEAEEDAGDWAGVIEAKLPRSTRERLIEAVGSSSAVSGILALSGLGGPRLAWRANPWGNGAEEMSGIVMVVTAKRAAREADLVELGLAPTRPAAAPAQVLPEPPPAPVVVPPPRESRPPSNHRALEWVKHPILLVSIETAEVIYANRAAREAFHVPADRRSFVENVCDLSGFPSDPDPLTITTAGHLLLHLKMGARVGRMFDYDDDLLFVEYHDEPRPLRIPAVVAAHAAR